MSAKGTLRAYRGKSMCLAIFSGLAKAKLITLLDNYSMTIIYITFELERIE
jgi:hypothetical protein